MTPFVVRRLLAVAMSLFVATGQVLAQTEAPAASLIEPMLFAVEITVGARWDPNKPPQEQPYFRDHSSNLKRLRDAGALVMGARYADKGLVVLAAKDEASARAMMDEDPSVKAEVFKYQIHPFHVFYGGTVHTRRRQVAP